MHRMSTPLVIEAPMQLEPVTIDDFIADLDTSLMAGDARLTAFVERLVASPHRRIYD